MTSLNSCLSEAPSTRAASSRSRSTPASPVRAERMKNGAETNVWARITATVVNGTEMPRSPKGAESSPRRPKTRRRASPATAGGRTIGRSTIASTRPLPRNRRRARTTASGKPSVTVITRLMAVVTRLSRSASRTIGEATATRSDPSRIARRTSVMTGSPRNKAKRAASAVSERSARRPALRGSGLERPTAAGATPGLPAAPSITTPAGGTRSWPGLPGRRARRTRPGRPGPRRHSGTP